MLPDEQRTRGFALQSFFIGVGAVVAELRLARDDEAGSNRYHGSEHSR